MSIDRIPLIQFRKRLDQIDQEIIRLFAQRYRVRDKTMIVKKEHDMSIESPERMNEVIEQVQVWAKNENVPIDFAKALYELVMDYSHKYEEDYRSQCKESKKEML